MTIKTDTYRNFTEAENDTFSWTNIDGETLTHKATGRHIYQMHWIGDDGYMADEVEGDIRTQALSFLAELSSIRIARAAETENTRIARIIANAKNPSAHEKLVQDMDKPESDL